MKKRGRGMACMWYPIGFTVAANPSAATVKVNTDGTATLLTGTVETGQGALTVLGQIAAEALGIATDDVHVVSADTDTTPMDTGAIASRTTYVTGNAIIKAAEQAREILFEAAAPMLNVKPEQLEARDRKIQVLGFPQQYKTIGEVAHHSEIVIGRPAIGSGSYNPPTVEMDPETGQGKPFSTYVYATQIADVEVDDETGEVEVLRIVAAHDCGTPINPMLVEGQIHGGIAQGIGQALTEGMAYNEDGQPLSASLMDYALPRAAHIPDLIMENIDTPSPTNPLGSKGVGSVSTVPSPVAVANAVLDALSSAGVRHIDTPLTPEKIWRALQG